MVSEDVPAQANKILGLNTGAGPRLQLLDVGNWYALIEPESMFWALVAKDKDLSTALQEEVFPMYRQHAANMKGELEQFARRNGSAPFTSILPAGATPAASTAISPMISGSRGTT